MDKQLQITIPQAARNELGLDQGGSICFVEQEYKYWKKFNIESASKPRFPFGQRVPEYRVSSQGQVTVPRYVLDALGIENKEELYLEYNEAQHSLTLARAFHRQFEDVLLSLRPNFYEDRENELLTLIQENGLGSNNDRLLYVNSYEFSKLRSLYSKLRHIYEPASKDSWIGVPELGDQGLSITLDETVKPTQLVITKLGDKYISDPLVSRLWRERIAFILEMNKIYYTDQGEMHVQEVDSNQAKNIMRIFNRNAKKFGYYRDAVGRLVETVIFYTGDMAVFRSPRHAIEFLPKRNP